MESVLSPKRARNVQDEAAEWLLAGEAGLDAAQARAFTRWLAAAPGHLAEYRAMQRLGRDLARACDSGASVDELVERARAADGAPDEVVAFEAGGRNAGAVPRRRYIGLALAAAVAVLALGLVVAWPQLHGRFDPQVRESRHVSGHGKRLFVPLQDGSVMRLDSDSAVVVRYAAKARQVTLEYGRAMFEVRHDAARPFSVQAGGVRVLDIGTRFDVYMQPAGTLVTVIEGRVEVSAAGAPGSRLLDAGQQIRVAAAGGLPQPAAVDVERATAYLRRNLEYEQLPLEALVEEYNRYAAKRFVIMTPQLRRMRVSGSVSVDDPQSFLDFLRSLPRVRVESTGDRILVFQF